MFIKIKNIKTSLKLYLNKGKKNNRSYSYKETYSKISKKKNETWECIL